VTLAAAGMSAVTPLVLRLSGVATILDGILHPWVNNLATLSQIAVAVVVVVGTLGALGSWCLARIKRSGLVKPAKDSSRTELVCLGQLLPSRDRERFVREAMANMADRQRWWQRVEELLSVAAAVPGLTVILGWAQRRRG
jgi:hypothetical protein